jgi:predicted nuclease of predicted toxin-antitoxin system
MRIIADESVNYSLVKDIRNLGIEVLSIAEDYASLQDIDIVSLSIDPPALILTEDKDFGELVYKNKVEVKAVILLRYVQPELAIVRKRLLTLLIQNIAEIENSFSVITSNKTRIRTL